MRKRALEGRLAAVEGFERPRSDLEQYPTPADVAAQFVHFATLQGDVEGRTVVDLGAGTGMLALAAALAGADRVVGVERDEAALGIARENERRIAPGDRSVAWLCGDAARPPLRLDDATVVMNPPFGAQRGNEHADRAFLLAAADLGRVSYSLHNAESRAFVESLAADHGGVVTHAFAVRLALDRQFRFHDEARREIDAEAFRVEWSPDHR